MRRIAVVAVLTVALASLSGCADLDGYGDYGGGQGYRGNYGYRPGPQPYWGQGYAPQPQYGYRGGGDYGRSTPSRDPGPIFRGPAPVARAAPGPVPRGAPTRGTGGQGGARVEQGAD